MYVIKARQLPSLPNGKTARDYTAANKTNRETKLVSQSSLTGANQTQCITAKTIRHN